MASEVMKTTCFYFSDVPSIVFFVELVFYHFFIILNFDCGILLSNPLAVSQKSVRIIPAITITEIQKMNLQIIVILKI